MVEDEHGQGEDRRGEDVAGNRADDLAEVALADQRDAERLTPALDRALQERRGHRQGEDGPEALAHERAAAAERGADACGARAR